MDLELQLTEDGSHTLFWKEKNEHYHSVHGSVNESRIVYIESALDPAIRYAETNGFPVLRVFEMGFGTGLNALLSLCRAQCRQIRLEYVSIEARPLPEKVWKELNYPALLSGFGWGVPEEIKSWFESLHRQPYDGLFHPASPFFDLKKIEGQIQSAELPPGPYHAIFYDAFAPSVQPELWEVPIFEKLYRAAAFPCWLSTYCAQGRFKRILRQVGFEVENLPGPIGKREITRGLKRENN